MKVVLFVKVQKNWQEKRISIYRAFKWRNVQQLGVLESKGRRKVGGGGGDVGRPLLNQYTRQFVARLAKVLMLLKE